MTKERDWARFCKLLELAAEVTAASKKSDAAAALMFEMLKRYTFEQINDAVMQHIRISRFFPAPADIINQIEGSAEDRARLSFRLVLDSMRRIGPYHTVQFSDPRIHYALEAVGGWEKLAECPEDEIQFLEKRYAGHYQDADRLGLTWGSSSVPDCLPGIIWRENGAKGHALPPAKCIDQDGGIKELPAHEVKALPDGLARQAIKALERRAEG